MSCSLLFASNSEMKHHMKTEHVEMTLDEPTELKTILENIEEKLDVPRKSPNKDVFVNQFSCELCRSNFQNLEDLKIHMDRYHPGRGEENEK